MRYRVSDIKVDIDFKKEELGSLISKKYKCDVSNLEIIKEGLDARKKPNLKFVYTMDFDSKKKLNLPLSTEPKYDYPKKLNDKKVVIVGFGPSGMFASLILSRLGYKVTVLERGLDVDKRREKVEHFIKTGELDEDTNIQYGEGGAGTFSDGKLTTGIKDSRIRFVLREFVNHGANPDIMYKGKPHIGTDVLINVVKNIREEILSLGSEVIFNAKVIDFKIENDLVTVVKYLKDGREESITCDSLVLAVGNSARDIFRLLKEKDMNLEKKPFSIGLRVIHNQDMIDISQYGDTSSNLKLEPATYKLNTVTSTGRGVYTFCMCPGGYVINASSKNGELCINGMSKRNRDSGYANSAVLSDVRLDDLSSDILSGIEFQEKYERLAFLEDSEIPENTVGNFLDGKAKNLENCLPSFAVDAIKESLPIFGKKIKGFDSRDAVLKAVETRSSCPVRILRDINYKSSIKNIYPIGEGAGYAGGIMSSAVDGIKLAEKIAEEV